MGHARPVRRDGERAKGPTHRLRDRTRTRLSEAGRRQAQIGQRRKRPAAESRVANADRQALPNACRLH